MSDVRWCGLPLACVLQGYYSEIDNHSHSHFTPVTTYVYIVYQYPCQFSSMNTDLFSKIIFLILKNSICFSLVLTLENGLLDKQQRLYNIGPSLSHQLAFSLSEQCNPNSLSDVSHRLPVANSERMWANQGQQLLLKGFQMNPCFDKEQQCSWRNDTEYLNYGLTLCLFNVCVPAGCWDDGGWSGPRLPELGRHERWERTCIFSSHQVFKGFISKTLIYSIAHYTQCSL